MGVNRLWSYIRRNKHTVVTEVDLVQVAREHPRGLKILVDFYAWEHFMTTVFWNSLSASTQNQYLVFAGGEYKMMDAFIRSFVEQMRHVNIELVFFLDGAKGSAPLSTKQKMQTWQQRHIEDQERLRKTLDFFRGKISMNKVDISHMTRPCLQEVQNVWTLQDCGCTIHMQVSGEADYAIAKYLRDDEAAFCVLSSDTDFCIFQHCTLMPFDFFDIHNDLGLGQQCLTVKQPKKLICQVVRTESVMRLLNLPDHESLIEFAVISGNDFTGPHLLDLPEFQASFMGQTSKLASLVRRNRVAEQCGFFGPLIRTNPALKEAVVHSRQFYTLTVDNEEEKESGRNFNIIVRKISEGRLPSTIMAMHRGRYWHRMVLEDPDSGLPSADLALTALRAYVYAILLPSDVVHAIELGRNHNDFLEEILVRKCIDSRVPSLHEINSNSFKENLRLFERIIQHQEPAMLQGLAEEGSYFQMFGMRKGFLCYLLRYFLLLNWEQNMFISKQEFYVTAAWVLAQHNTSAYQRLKIVPSPRCVTVQNWFLALYRNVFAFLASILNLAHEFPPPSELFSGAVWVALYTGCTVFDSDPQTREPFPQSVSKEDLWKARSDVNHIVAVNRNIIVNIIKGLFQLD